MGRHKVDGPRRDHLRRHRQVAFVLTVLVVDYDDHAPGPELLDSRIDTCKRWLISNTVVESECVSHLFLFRLQVTHRMRVWNSLAGDLGHNLDTVIQQGAA